MPERFIDGRVDFFLGGILALLIDAVEIVAHGLGNLNPTC